MNPRGIGWLTTPYPLGQRPSSGRWYVPNRRSSSGKWTAKLTSIASRSMPWCQWWNRGVTKKCSSGPKLSRMFEWTSGRQEEDEDQVRVEGRLGEAEHVHRDHGEAAEEDDLHDVHPRAGEPVHHLRRVMDGVEVPQPRHAVESAVDPVLHQVGEEHDLHELQDQAADCRPSRGSRPSRCACRIASDGASDMNVSACTNRLLMRK